jgi:hypothetical protein
MLREIMQRAREIIEHAPGIVEHAPATFSIGPSTPCSSSCENGRTATGLAEDGASGARPLRRLSRDGASRAAAVKPRPVQAARRGSRRHDLVFDILTASLRALPMIDYRRRGRSAAAVRFGFGHDTRDLRIAVRESSLSLAHRFLIEEMGQTLRGTKDVARRGASDDASASRRARRSCARSTMAGRSVPIAHIRA